MAADEASSFIEGGPNILAECLVELGRRIHHPSPAAWLGIHGSRFRSNLGRRMSRLVHLNDQGSLQRFGVLPRLGIVLSLTGVSLLTVLGTSWLMPRRFAAGNSAGQPSTESWQHSVVGLAFAALWTPAEDPDSLARGTSPSTHDAARSSQANETNGAVGGLNEGQTEVAIEVRLAAVPENLVEVILGPWLKTNAVNDLNSHQARELFKTLSKRPEAVMVSAPNVTRPTDRQITYSIAVKGPTPTKSAPAGSDPHVANVASILSLYMIPFVTTNGQAVRLTLTPSLLEFTGYSDGAKYGEEVGLQRFLSRRADTSQTTLSDGHTAVIGWLWPDGFSLRSGEIAVWASDGSDLGQPVRGGDRVSHRIAVGNRLQELAPSKSVRAMGRCGTQPTPSADPGRHQPGCGMPCCWDHHAQQE